MAMASARIGSASSVSSTNISTNVKRVVVRPADPGAHPATPKVIRVTTADLESLLDTAASRLHMPARRLFLANGGEIVSLDDINEGDTLYVTAGGPLTKASKGVGDAGEDQLRKTTRRFLFEGGHSDRMSNYSTPRTSTIPSTRRSSVVSSRATEWEVPSYARTHVNLMPERANPKGARPFPQKENKENTAPGSARYTPRYHTPRQSPRGLTPRQSPRASLSPSPRPSSARSESGRTPRQASVPRSRSATPRSATPRSQLPPPSPKLSSTGWRKKSAPRSTARSSRLSSRAPSRSMSDVESENGTKLVLRPLQSAQSSKRPRWTPFDMGDKRTCTPPSGRRPNGSARTGQQQPTGRTAFSDRSFLSEVSDQENLVKTLIAEELAELDINKTVDEVMQYINKRKAPKASNRSSQRPPSQKSRRSSRPPSALRLSAVPKDEPVPSWCEQQPPGAGLRKLMRSPNLEDLFADSNRSLSERLASARRLTARLQRMSKLMWKCNADYFDVPQDRRTTQHHRDWWYNKETMLPEASNTAEAQALRDYLKNRDSSKVEVESESKSKSR